jgi:hypothetical protein
MPALCSRNTKAGRAAVEDGHFLGRDVDVQVVQPQPGAGRQQVLDGLHLGRHPGRRRPADGGGHARVVTVPATGMSTGRRNAGISISSMPLLASASTLAAAWLRALRHTLGVFMLL